MGRPGPLATIFIFSCVTLSFLGQPTIILVHVYPSYLNFKTSYCGGHTDKAQNSLLNRRLQIVASNPDPVLFATTPGGGCNSIESNVIIQLRLHNLRPVCL